MSEDIGAVQAPETIELHTTEERRQFLERQNRERPGFMSIREQVTYNPPKGRKAVSSLSRYGYQTKSKEQVWSRQTEASIPHPLDWGWFSDKQGEIGEVLISNNEGRFDRNPTDQEREEMSWKVLTLYFDGIGIARIEPGRSMRFQPMFFDRYSIGAGLGKTVDYTLTVFPR